MAWLWNTLGALVLMVPIFPLFPWLAKHGLRADVALVSFYAGTSLTMLFIARTRVENLATLAEPLWGVTLIFLAGVLLGGFGNYLYSQALVQAPNVALPYAFVGFASVVTYLLAFLASRIIPGWPPQEGSFEVLFWVIVLVGSAGRIAYLLRPG